MGKKARVIRSVLITNLHSAQNLGDEAINRVTLEMVTTAFPAAKVTFAANHPQSWQKFAEVHTLASMSTWGGDAVTGDWKSKSWQLPFFAALLGLCAFVYRYFGRKLYFGSQQQRTLQAAYYAADLVLSCGGGNFYANSATSPAYLWSLLTVAFAVALGKPTWLLPQSIGPISGQIQRFLTRLTLNRTEQILVREQRSLAFASDELGLTAPIQLMPDLAFGLASVGTLPSALVSQPRNDIIHIGLTPMDRQAQDKRFGRQKEYEEILVSLVQKLSQEQPIRCSIIAQCHGPSADQDDRVVARRLYEKLLSLGVEVELCDAFDNLNDLLLHFRQLDCLIGTRMHTAILGFTQSIPTTLLAYQPKAHGVMQMMQMADYCIDIHNVTFEALSQRVRRMLEQRSMLVEQIELHVTKLQQELQQIPAQLVHSVSTHSDALYSE